MAVTLDVEGPAAPPRLNGELVFDAPWEGRSFAMAMALVEEGLFDWDGFRDHLIAAVQRWEARPVGEYRYYAARPPGHDHGDHDHHDHDHDHDHHDHDHHDHDHHHDDH